VDVTAQPLSERIDQIRRDFPARFSKEVIDQLRIELRSRLITDGTLLDPFAGIGGIHVFREDGFYTLGVEIEPEFAVCDPITIEGDSTRLTEIPALLGHVGRVRAIVTSPAYGNRMADQYLGSDDEKCRRCNGSGQEPVETSGARSSTRDCTMCGATGKAKSKRRGYAVALGRKTSANSGGGMPWGPRYRSLHGEVVQQCARMLEPGGWWLLNVSSFLNTEGYQPVMEWWVGQVARVATVEALVAVPTRRMRHGENSERRVHAEHIIVARAPRTELLT
jgi:tRNA G10  N-methylase Trm11